MSEQQMVNPMPEPAPADNPAEGTLDEAINAEIERLNQRADVAKVPSKPESEADQPEEENTDEGNAAEEGEDAAEEEQPDGDLVEAEYEGKKYRVPPELKDALLRQADYTRKTAEVAEGRKQVESFAKEAAELFNAGQEYIQASGYLSLLDRQIQQTEQTTDWSRLRQDDVVEFSARHAELQRMYQHRSAVADSIERQKAVYAQNAMKRTQQQVEEGQRVVKELYPDWSPDRAREIGRAAMAAGVRLETLQALNDGFDPRALAWLASMHEKATKYDAVQSGKAEAIKKAAVAPPVVKAGSAPNPNRNSLEQAGRRLRSSGSVNDAVAYELALSARRR